MTNHKRLYRGLALILGVLLFLAPIPAYALPIMADTENLGTPEESETESQSESQTEKDTAPEGERESESAKPESETSSEQTTADTETASESCA